MTTSKRSNHRIRKPLNGAKNHWLYSEADVLTVFGISRNTLINWRKDGLQSIKVHGERLFRGCDLNRYQYQRREKAKRACAPHEVYCLRCKNLHSLLVEPHQIERNVRGGFHIHLICPDTDRPIRKFCVRDSSFMAMDEAESKTSGESHDYSASSPNAEFGQDDRCDAEGLVLENEYLIYRYQLYLIQASGRNKKTVDSVLRAIRTFQAWLGARPFYVVSEGEIGDFKVAYESGEATASFKVAGTRELKLRSRGSSTIVHCLGALEAFFRWLRQKGGCDKIRIDLPDYFRPSRHHARVAAAAAEKHVPSLEDVKKVISNMPFGSWKQRRDRALVAFLCLSGMRDGAVIGLRIKHIDTEKRLIFQDPREIKTKNSKTMRTWWFPVGDEIADIVVSWIEELKACGLKENDPLFPQTPSSFSSIVAHKHWATATPLRVIVKKAILDAHLVPFRPHAIRAMLACLGDMRTQSFEERKAWSQNLGHEHVATTEAYYAKVDGARQGQIFNALWKRTDATIDDEFLDLIRTSSPEKLQAVSLLLRESRG